MSMGRCPCPLTFSSSQSYVYRAFIGRVIICHCVFIISCDVLVCVGGEEGGRGVGLGVWLGVGGYVLCSWDFFRMNFLKCLSFYHK